MGNDNQPEFKTTVSAVNPAELAKVERPTESQTARLVDQRFRLESLIARGGMGTVYRARDTTTNELVAIKFLQGGIQQGEERFLRETQVLETLNHPGIVRYVGHGRASTREPYLVMEWLEGESLATRLKQGPLSLRDTLNLAAQVADALGSAHDHGIVHRDLNPHNLFLVCKRVERVKLLDFGIAQLKFATLHLTQAGTAIGTPGYMAPEQAGSGSAIGGRADLFSLGCVLFECITGARAFAGTNLIEILAKVLLDEPPRLRMIQPSIPTELDELVRSLLAKDAEKRPASAGIVARRLKTIESLLPSTHLQQPESRHSITGTENRLISVLVATDAFEGKQDSPELEEQLEALAARFSVKIDRLGSASLIATLVGQGDATDQAARAARFALSVRDVVGSAPMALATGHGHLARGGPVGPPTDRATTSARDLLAEPETSWGSTSPIVIDDVTAGLLDARFEVRRTGQQLTLHGLHQSREPLRTLLGVPTRCVGRHRELATLNAAYEQAVEESTSHAVVVLAEAGMGKTRLRQEFLKQLLRHHEPPRVWFGQGNPITEGSPFELVQQMIHRWLGTAPEDGAAARQQRLRVAVERHLGQENAARVCSFLGELLGISLADSGDIQVRAARLDPVLKGDQMCRAFEDLIHRLASSQPQVFLIDDLQWGDFSTLRMFDGILRNSSAQPVLVVALGRPEATRTFGDLFARRNATELRLGPLSPKAQHSLIEDVLGQDASDTTKERMVELSGGNALWLEELLRSRARQDARTSETVVAMAQSRLSRLDPVTRQVLRAGSVFGSRFWRNGTRSIVSALSDEQFEAALSELTNHEVTLVSRTSRFPDEAEWEFANDLLREAAYASFTDDDKQLGHRLAAEWLEAAGESDAVVLARHWLTAKRPERAVAWFLKATTQALEGNDFRAVLAFSQSALDSNPSQEERARLHLIRSTAFKWLGNNRSAQDAGAEAMGAAEGGSAAWCEAVGEAGVAAGKLGDGKSLVLLTRVLLSSQPKQRAQDAYAIALSRMASQLVFANELALAESLTAKVSTMISGYNSGPEVIAWFYEARAVHAGSTGDLGARLRLAEAATESFETAGDLRNASLQRVSAGFACNELGAYDEAIKNLERAFEWASRCGIENTAAIAKLQLGRAKLGAQELADAERELRAAMTALDAQGNQRLGGNARSLLALTLLQRGHNQAAQQLAEEAVAMLTENPALLPHALMSLALTQLTIDTDEAAPNALSSAERAVLGLSGPGSSTFGEVGILLTYAKALHRNGRKVDASVALARAAESIRNRSKAIVDRVHQQSFLDEPTNAEVKRLATAWNLEA